ncbi:MAG: hypothetical protein KBA61_18065 [Spirochaetes bacterium]|nr:hypothetical protein [Spirochaetota bacterium]
MDFQSLLFDIYYLSEKVQHYSNEISGLEFADERGYLDDSETGKLRLYADSLEETKKIAEARLREAREKYRDNFHRHLDDVVERVAVFGDQLKEKNDDKLKFDIEMLEDLIVHVKDVRQGREPKYSVWWVFFYIQSVLCQSGEFRFSGKSLGDGVSPIRPRCPACSFENDITNTINIFLPPTGVPWQSVTILDEYACAGCRQRFRVMFKIHFGDPVRFEIISVDFPPVSFTW